LKVFPVAAAAHHAQRAISIQGIYESKRGLRVLRTRATTGLGGLIVVTAILLIVQAATGIGALPL
jgi:hypothetical protein